MRTYYRLFGLCLASNLPLTGLLSVPFTQWPDVDLSLGELPPWLNDTCRSAAELDYVSGDADEQGDPAVRTWKLNGGAHIRLRFSDDVEFVFDRLGRRLWSAWPDTLSEADMAAYLFGPVMGLLLRLRGIVCLHASAIAVNDRVIAFLGRAGAGKSTTAAAFAKLGFPVLTDDIVALSDCNETFLVPPGEPRLRLWPASVEALYGSPEFLPRMTPTWEKRYLNLQQDGYRLQQETLPLAAVYVLDERIDGPFAPTVEVISPRDQVMVLIAHSYANGLLDKAMRAHEFELMGRVAQRVPIKRVRPNADARKLPELCRLILDDFCASEIRSRAGSVCQDNIDV